MCDERLENLATILENDNLNNRSSEDAIKEMLKSIDVTMMEYKLYDANDYEKKERVVEKKSIKVGEKNKDNSQLKFELKSHSGNIRTEFKIYSIREIDKKNKILLKDLCATIFVILENKELQRKLDNSKKTIADGLVDANEYVKDALELVKKYKNNNYLAVIVAINDFDAMTRLYGEDIGFEIIRKYADGLVKICEENELVAHRGNDKFSLLIKKNNKDKILSFIENFEVKQIIDGRENIINITASAGMSNIEAENANVEKLIVEPRLAISYGKDSGEKVVLITNELREKMLVRRQIEDTFATALEKEYIKLWFQPKIDIRTDEIVGVEALARWIEPDKKYFPGEFVPILEDAGLIKDLDFYVLERACKYMAEWQKKGNELVPLSLNFSRKNLEDINLAYKINDIIEKYRLDKKKIIIEITETATEQMKNKMHYFLDSMRNYGIQTSVDDFGTGYASLAMLRDFNLDEIKIDRSFINIPIFKHKYQVIVEGIIEMAKSLGMKVIVEGVETELQKEFLKEVGCYYVQGYLYDKPLPREKFEERLLKGYKTEE